MAKRSVFQEMYDWFYRRYGETSKETLLELMKDDVDIQRLRRLAARIGGILLSRISVLSSWSRPDTVMRFGYLLSRRRLTKPCRVNNVKEIPFAFPSDFELKRHQRT